MRLSVPEVAQHCPAHLVHVLGFDATFATASQLLAGLAVILLGLVFARSPPLPAPTSAATFGGGGGVDDSSFSS